jgi:hypothetical protein
MPVLELPERCADVGERKGRGDRHVKLAFGDQSGGLRQDPGVPRLLAALGLDTGLSIFVAASILLGRRFAPRFPVSLVVVVGTIAASAWLRLAEHGFAVIGPVPGSLPSLKWPT